MQTLRNQWRQQFANMLQAIFVITDSMLSANYFRIYTKFIQLIIETKNHFCLIL